MALFTAVGMLESQSQMVLRSWDSFLFQSLSLQGFWIDEAVSRQAAHSSVSAAITSLGSFEEPRLFHEALAWFGLLLPLDSHFQSSMPPLPKGPIAPIDAFAILLSHKLAYEPHERDMVVLHHEILTKSKLNPEAPEEKHTSSLVAYGDSETSAMAKTVGLPVAIAALVILDGKVDGLRGVVGPTASGVWRPVLDGLEELGIKMEEKSERIDRGVTMEGVVGKSVTQFSGKV